MKMTKKKNCENIFYAFHSLTVSLSSSDFCRFCRGMNIGAPGSSIEPVLLIILVSSTERSDTEDTTVLTLGSLSERHDEGDVIIVSRVSNVPIDP